MFKGGVCTDLLALKTRENCLKITFWYYDTIHNGKKNYCTHCAKYFSDASNLKKHILMQHEGVRSINVKNNSKNNKN